MSETVVWIALVIHILLCALYYVLIKKGIAHLTGSMIPIMLLVPLFGPLSVLLVEWILVRKKDGTRKTDLHKLNLGEDSVYNKVMIDEGEMPQKVVPLEEAILINDVPTRRAIMLDILHRDPGQFLDLLMVARFNSDIEVTHYATTTIMEIQREFELAIQQISAAVKNSPNDEQALDKYIDVLDKYIRSGLLHGHLLVQQRAHYSIALEKKISLNSDSKETYFEIIDNDIGMKDYSHAEEISQIMQKQWPTDENVWFATMRIFVESGNSKAKAKLVNQMRDLPISWTTGGKERMAFWCGPQLIKNEIPSNDEANESIEEAI